MGQGRTDNGQAGQTTVGQGKVNHSGAGWATAGTGQASPTHSSTTEGLSHPCPLASPYLHWSQTKLGVTSRSRCRHNVQNSTLTLVTQLPETEQSRGHTTGYSVSVLATHWQL